MPTARPHIDVNCVIGPTDLCPRQFESLHLYKAENGTFCFVMRMIFFRLMVPVWFYACIRIRHCCIETLLRHVPAERERERC